MGRRVVKKRQKSQIVTQLAVMMVAGQWGNRRKSGDKGQILSQATLVKSLNLYLD